MAIAYARVAGASRPDLGMTVTDVTLDGSYAAGGYALSAAGLGLLTDPSNVVVNYTHATATTSNVAQWISSTGKVRIFEETGNAGPLVECVAGDITSSHVLRVTAYGAPLL